MTELIGNGYAAGGILLFPMLWGALVFQYAYLVTTAGVMARWSLQPPQTTPLWQDCRRVHSVLGSKECLMVIAYTFGRFLLSRSYLRSFPLP